MPTRPTVVLTREPRDNEALERALQARSIPVRQIPCVRTRYVDPSAEGQRILSGLGAGDVLAFTSHRAVTGFTRWTGSGEGLAGQVVVTAVGERTAQALRDVSMAPSIVASPPTGEQLARSILERLGTDVTVVLPGAEKRAGGLVDVLGEAGVRVHCVTVYRNEAPPIPRLEPFEVAAVFAAAPSAARRLIRAMPWMREVHFVAIGPTTARALHQLGAGDVMTPQPDPRAWEEALASAYSRLTSDPGV